MVLVLELSEAKQPAPSTNFMRAAFIFPLHSHHCYCYQRRSRCIIKHIYTLLIEEDAKHNIQLRLISKELEALARLIWTLSAESFPRDVCSAFGVTLSAL